MQRILLLLTAPCLLAGSAYSQTTLPVQRATPPKFAGVYKAATGEFSPTTGGARSGPDVIFNNMVATNYYAVPGAGQEWIDEGGLVDRAGEFLDQINGFDFIYCSTDPAPTGAITISFYRQTLECVGPLLSGTPDGPDCSYLLSGLPLGTPTGGLQCWIVHVDLSGGAECPSDQAFGFPTEDAQDVNRLFGWGFLPGDANTGPWLRQGGRRTTNNFLWWDSLGQAMVGCFWFGGTPFASFALRLYGGPEATWRYWPDAPGPRDTLTLDSTAVVPGQSATWSVAPTTAGRFYWLIASPDWNQFPAVGGTVLFDYPVILPPTPVSMPGGNLTTTVPQNLPERVWTQAVETSTPALMPASITGFSNSLVHANTKGGTRKCEVLTFDVPKNRSGCPTIENLGGGMKKVGEKFEMDATFGGANPECCEYRQYIKGTFEANGAPVAHPLPGKKMLEKDVFHEDGLVPANPPDNEHYGHRDEGDMDTTDVYSNPDRATGKNYDGSDYPGLTGPTPFTYDINLTFLGEIIDVCNGNKEVKCSEWTVKCSGTVSTPEDRYVQSSTMQLAVESMPVILTFATYRTPRLTISVSFPNGAGEVPVDATAVALEVDGLTPSRVPTGHLIQTHLRGAAAHAIYEYAWPPSAELRTLRGVVSVRGSRPVPFSVQI
ncbi:MAG: hypothetical protein EYC70_04850 [Planctomycetota bacterium]|nr:MAG: hypothetical protein EYC70_04850 [Planctomycetota bacterium]